MIKLFSEIFIKDNENLSLPSVRRGYGLICAAAGIALNLLMFFFKLAASTLTGSVAAAVDAIHNLTDSASSVVTLLSFLFSDKRKTDRFPSGLGRIEYIAGFIISVVLLSAGFKLASSSVTKIITPEPVTFSLLSVSLLLISVLTKFYMARFNSYYGKKISSAALKASATDCLCDSIATLIAAFAVIAIKFTPFNFDAWGGLAVSLFILYAGIKSMKDTISQLLGSVPDEKMINAVASLPCTFPEIKTTDNILLHDYGVNNKYLSFEVFFEDGTDSRTIRNIQSNAENEIRKTTGCETLITIRFQ